MKNFLKTIFTSNAFKTFCWSIANFTIVFLADSILANIGLLNLPTEAVTVIGFALNGVTKYFNKKSLSNA